MFQLRLVLIATLALLGFATLVSALAPPPAQPDNARRDFMKSILAASSSGAITMASLFQPIHSASAYEVRVIGDDKPSPTMAAFNIQIRETTARLEREGFPLDSREDEAKRLGDALASFSYDSTTSSSKKSTKKPVYQKDQKSTEK